MKLVGKKKLKNQTHLCNIHCHNYHVFSWKVNSYDSNKAKNHIRECNEDDRNTILHQEHEAQIKSRNHRFPILSTPGQRCAPGVGGRILLRQIGVWDLRGYTTPMICRGLKMSETQ